MIIPNPEPETLRCEVEIDHQALTTFQSYKSPKSLIFASIPLVQNFNHDVSAPSTSLRQIGSSRGRAVGPGCSRPNDPPTQVACTSILTGPSSPSMYLGIGRRPRTTLVLSLPLWEDWPWLGNNPWRLGWLSPRPCWE